MAIQELHARLATTVDGIPADINNPVVALAPETRHNQGEVNEAVRRSLPIFPDKRTLSVFLGTSQRANIGSFGRDVAA